MPVLETISYGSYIAYVFDPATSCDKCDANRTVTVINPVIVILDWAVDKVGGEVMMRGFSCLISCWLTYPGCWVPWLV